MTKGSQDSDPPDSGASSILLGPADDSSGFFTPLWENKDEPGSEVGPRAQRQPKPVRALGAGAPEPSASPKRVRMPMPAGRGGSYASSERPSRPTSPDGSQNERELDAPAGDGASPESAADLSRVVEQPEVGSPDTGREPHVQLLLPDTESSPESLTGAGLLRQLRRTVELADDTSIE